MYKDLINTNLFDLNNLPKEINISTMCASCKINTKINIIDIENYLELNDENILAIKINNDKIKTLLIIKDKNIRKRKIKIKKKDTSKNFFLIK